MVRLPLREGRSLIRTLWPAYLLASVLILYGFGWGLPDNPYQDRSFHADENAAVWAVQQVRFPLFNARWLPWGTGLFYQVYLVKQVVTLGGLVPVTEYSIYVLGRLVVYLSALGAITLVFLLGRRLFDVPTGRLAALVLAVLPGFASNSHYFKADVPVTFWLLATLLAAARMIQSRDAGHLPVVGLLVGYTVSMKYNAAALYPAGLLAVALTVRTPPRRLYWIDYPTWVLVGFVLGTPYALLNARGFIDALVQVGNVQAMGSPYTVSRPPGWIDYLVNVLPLSVTAPMLVLAVAAVGWTALKGGRLLWPIWGFALCYYLAMGLDRLRLVRYTVPLLPVLALCVAYAIRSLWAVRSMRPAVAAGAAAVIAYAFLFSLSYVHAMAQPDPRIQASRWIHANIRDRPPLAVSTTHYLDAPQVQLMGYPREEVGFSVARLREVASPYLILSELGTRVYLEDVSRHPQQQEFFDHVQRYYTEVARFENPQRLLGVDSKRGRRLAHDWLLPNPRIVIFERGAGSTRLDRRQAPLRTD